MYEVDGAFHKLYCQNLCLLAKVGWQQVLLVHVVLKTVDMAVANCY